MTYEPWELEILNEISNDLHRNNPVHTDYKLARFVSYSAGKGRKRRTPKDVALVVRKNGGQATSWAKFPFDEAPGMLDGSNDLSEQDFINTLLDGQSEPDR